MGLITFLLAVLVLDINSALVLSQGQMPNYTLVSCDGTGMVAKIFDVNRTYYTGNAYAQGSEISTNTALCGPEGTTWNLDGNEWTFNISFANMGAGNCGTFQEIQQDSNGLDNEYKTLLVVPRRNYIQVATDYRTIMICRWGDVKILSDTKNLTGIDPIPDTNVTRTDGSIMEPTVEAQFLDSADALIVERMELGDRVKLKVDLTENTDVFWSHLLILNLTAKADNPTNDPELPIIQDACPIADTMLYINGIFEGDNNNVPPVIFEFDSFRFHSDVPVLFDIFIRVCSNETTCSVTCSDSRRKKREVDWNQGETGVLELVNQNSKLTRPSRERRAAQKTKAVAKNTDADITNNDHVDIGLQLVALVESEDVVDDTDNYLSTTPDDSSVFRKAGEESNFRILNLEGNTERTPVTKDESPGGKTTACFNRTQLIIICVLAVLMLLLTAASTAFSCCRILITGDGHRSLRRNAMQNNAAPAHDFPPIDISKESRCTNCGCCISAAEAKSSDCECWKAPPTQNKNRTSVCERGFIRPTEYHYGLYKDKNK